MERDNLIDLINTYNEASSPSVPRTEEEHVECNLRAKIARGSIRRNFIEGVDYKELSNGALWPISHDHTWNAHGYCACGADAAELDR